MAEKKRAFSIPLIDPPSVGILKRVAKESVEGRIVKIDDEHYRIVSSDGARRYVVSLITGFMGDQLVIQLHCTCQAGFQKWCYHRVHVADRLGLIDLTRLMQAAS